MEERQEGQEGTAQQGSCPPKGNGKYPKRNLVEGAPRAKGPSGNLPGDTTGLWGPAQFLVPQGRTLGWAPLSVPAPLFSGAKWVVLTH